MFQNNLIAGASGQGGFYPYEIEQSLRFNDDDSAYLSRTPAGAGNRKTWTWSAWVKRGNLGATGILFVGGQDANNYINIYLHGSVTDAIEVFQATGGANSGYYYTPASFRDTSAWYHIVVVCDTTNAGDKISIYVNGVGQSLTVNTQITLNSDTWINSANSHKIGANQGLGNYFDGYLAEVNFIDGTALTPTSFGETKSGIWVPKAYAGAYGTNGFYLSFADSAAIGDDLSGNGNDWTANNLVSTDVLLDSPTENYCVLNAVDNYNTGATLSEGNLKWVIGAADGATRSTFVMDSGKWYAEFLPSDYCGVVGIEDAVTDDVNGTPSVWYFSSGQKRVSGTVTSYGASYTEASDLIGLAVDLDAGEVTFYKNNVSQGAITLPASAGYAIAAGSGSGSKTSVLNFGQDSSFAGNETRQGNTDSNGVGDFYYAPPSGFLALCTANLPDPVIDPAQDDVPSDYFNTVLYTGTSATQSITGVGFQPDWVWFKRRGAVENHWLTDAVRGSTKGLFSNATTAETTRTDQLTSFDADGFSLGADAAGYTNVSGQSYVAWNWLAGNGTSSNSDGTITSTVSVSQKAGFSVVSYTGTAGGTQTVGHGLGAAPVFIISKNRTDAGTDWYTATGFLSGWNWNSDYFKLNTTGAKATDGGGTVFPVAPTSAVFTIGDASTNSSGKNYIAYCFADVEGYSKFGSYTGNGSTDGPFVYCGFRPAFVMFKRTDSTGEWMMVDDARQAFNSDTPYLDANSSAAESTSSNEVDFLSNGFKLRSAGGRNNASGGTYIFMAFAESPFKYANAR
jgi:hypothetical protein